MQVGIYIGVVVYVVMGIGAAADITPGVEVPAGQVIVCCMPHRLV